MSADLSALRIFRESTSIDEAVASYSEGSRTPDRSSPISSEGSVSPKTRSRSVSETSGASTDSAIVDFAGKILESQSNLATDDIPKLLQLEDKLSKDAPDQASKICKVCLTMLLKGKEGKEISKSMADQVNSLLAKVTHEEDRVKIITTIACLPVQDRLTAVNILLESITTGDLAKVIEEPLRFVFHAFERRNEGDGEKAWQRARAYLETRLDSKNREEAVSAAELIIARQKGLIVQEEDYLFWKAKSTFISPSTLPAFFEPLDQAIDPVSYKRELPPEDRVYTQLKESLLGGYFKSLMRCAGQPNEKIPPEAAKFFAILQHITNFSDEVGSGEQFSPRQRAFLDIMKTIHKDPKGLEAGIANAYERLPDEDRHFVITKPDNLWKGYPAYYSNPD